MRGMRPPDSSWFVRFRKALLAWTSLPVLIAFSWAIKSAQAKKPTSPKAKAGTKVDTSNLVVAPDLAEEVAKFKAVRMPFDSSKLAPREREMVGKLVEACQFLESI